MEKQTPVKAVNALVNIDEKILKAILKKHFYFSQHGAESEFDKLPGHLQRAVNREAEFQVKRLAQVEGLTEILTENEMKNAQDMHDALCEYITHLGNQEEKLNPKSPNNLFAKLLRTDSKAVMQNPFKYKDEDNAIDKSTRAARHINDKVKERKEKGTLTPAPEMFAKIMNHVKVNSKN